MGKLSLFLVSYQTLEQTLSITIRKKKTQFHRKSPLFRIITQTNQTYLFTCNKARAPKIVDDNTMWCAAATATNSGASLYCCRWFQRAAILSLRVVASKNNLRYSIVWLISLWSLIMILWGRGFTTLSNFDYYSLLLIYSWRLDDNTFNWMQYLFSQNCGCFKTLFYFVRKVINSAGVNLMYRDW